jgi:hypothetical protein
MRWRGATSRTWGTDLRRSFIGSSTIRVEISDPDWDIDAHMLSIDRLKLDDLSILVTEAIAAAAAAAERFAVAHASPLAFVAALKHELEDEWVSAGEFVAAPAVLAAAGLRAEARAEIDRARAEVGTSIPDAFWDHLDQLLNSGR